MTRELAFAAPGAAWATPSRRTSRSRTSRSASRGAPASARPSAPLARKAHHRVRSPSSAPRSTGTAPIFVPLEVCVAICPTAVAAALRLSGFDRAALIVGTVALALIATGIIKNVGLLAPPPPLPLPARRPRKDAANADCMVAAPPPTSLTLWFDSFAIVMGLGVCGLLCFALHVGDIDVIAEFIGGSRGGEQKDYAAEGSCRLWLTGAEDSCCSVSNASFLLFVPSLSWQLVGFCDENSTKAVPVPLILCAGGPWPPAGLIDAFLLFHFLDNFVVMLIYRDFWLLWMVSPMCEVTGWCPRCARYMALRSKL